MAVRRLFFYVLMVICFRAFLLAGKKKKKTLARERKIEERKKLPPHRTAPFLLRSHLHSACGSSRSLASGSVLSPPPLPPSAFPPPRDRARCSSCTRGLAGGVEPRPASEAVRSLDDEEPWRGLAREEDEEKEMLLLLRRLW